MASGEEARSLPRTRDKRRLQSLIVAIKVSLICIKRQSSACLKTNPFATMESTSDRDRTYRPMSWPATVPQFIALGMMLTVGWLVSQSPQGVACGAIVYLTYSFLSRRLIANSHRRGIELARSGRFNEAIGSYERSYEFFTRHVWLDRYRAITMMTPSAVCYREMALVNIAYAYLQLGDEKTACDYYERTLNEFPESEMATDSLLMLKGDGNSSLHNEQDSRRMN